MAIKVVKTASTENFSITPVKTTSGYFSLDIKSHKNPDQHITISHGEEFDDLLQIMFAVRTLNSQVDKSKGIEKPKSNKGPKPKASKEQDDIPGLDTSEEVSAPKPLVASK